MTTLSKINVRLLGFIPVLVAVLLPLPAAGATPDVVVSIKPLHSVVASVLGEAGDPQLLIDGAVSPHSFELRPSQARALQSADLLVLAGAGLEPFADRLDEPERQVIRMSEIEGMRLRPLGTAGPDDDHGHAADEQHDDHPAHGALDPHLWLDPANMMLLAGEVAEVLADLDPERAAAYRANADRLRGELERLDRSVLEQLDPVRDRPFVVGHDAYGYFTSRYRLRQVGVVTLAPELSPGARTVRALRQRVADLAPVCVFHEPGMAPELLRTIGEGLEVEYGELDPLGAGLPAGPSHYPALLRSLSARFVDCLDRLPNAL